MDSMEELLGGVEEQVLEREYLLQEKTDPLDGKKTFYIEFSKESEAPDQLSFQVFEYKKKGWLFKREHKDIQYQGALSFDRDGKIDITYDSLAGGLEVTACLMERGPRYLDHARCMREKIKQVFMNACLAGLNRKREKERGSFYREAGEQF